MHAPQDTKFTRPKLRDHRKFHWRRLQNRWPFFAWLAVALLATYFYLRGTQYGTLPGSAQTMKCDLSPLATDRVKAVFVKIGDSVTNGQIVAQMDTTIVDAQVAEGEANLAAAQNSWAAYEEQMLSLVRTCDNEIASTETTIAQQKAQKEADLAKLGELRSMQSKRDALFKSKLISEVEDDALRPEIAGLEKSVAAYDPLITMFESTLERRKKDRTDLQQSLRLGTDGDVRKAIAQKTAAETAILKAAVDMKKLERESYSLRVERDGIVSAIGVLPGTTAKVGDPVVSVVSGSHVIMGFLPEVRRGSLKVGDQGYAFRLTQAPTKVRVVAVAPEIDPIPARVRPSTAAQQSGVTFRAQRVVFETDGSADMAPGESVQIRLTSEFWAKVRYRFGFQW
jgi:multidrug resistance efflux pump